MRLLLSGATKTVSELQTTHYDLCRRHLGRLVQPNSGNFLGSIVKTSSGYWAMDNAAFSGFDWNKFWNMMVDGWDYMLAEPPLFVVAPDVVGDHAATLDLFELFRKCCLYEIGYVPVPLAFVLQEGATMGSVPWNEIDCLFVGGRDDDYKLWDSRDFCSEAKRRGKWLHIGRVNSLKRLRHCRDKLHADSVDGSGYSRFPSGVLRALQFLANESSQGQFTFI